MHQILESHQGYDVLLSYGKARLVPVPSGQIWGRRGPCGTTTFNTRSLSVILEGTMKDMDERESTGLQERVE